MKLNPFEWSWSLSSKSWSPCLMWGSSGGPRGTDHLSHSTWPIVTLRKLNQMSCFTSFSSLLYYLNSPSSPSHLLLCFLLLFPLFLPPSFFSFKFTRVLCLRFSECFPRSQWINVLMVFFFFLSVLDIWVDLVSGFHVFSGVWLPHYDAGLAIVNQIIN